MKKFLILVYAVLTFFFMVSGASALGISSANFEDVEQGKTYTRNITLLNSQNDFDNHFEVTVNGAITNWIKFTPIEFDIPKGKTQQIMLTLEVPKDAVLGEFRGTITAEGKMTVPSSNAGSGANVGYAVATKGNIYANVVKPGAVASVEITGVEVPESVPVGSVARFTVTSRNIGNIATSANFKLNIKKNDKLVVSVPGNPVDFNIGEEKTVKILWDTQGLAEGGYDAVVEVSTIARGSEKTTTTIYKPLSVNIGKNRNSIPSISISGVGILIIVISIFIKRQK